jgi:hypothetical protein
MACVVKGK